jgi:predicted dehydrogenase
VGYNLRFNLPLQLLRQALLEGRIGRPLAVRAEVGQYLPEWRPGDYRRGVSARKDLGGGVTLELSHELDYMRWLLGEVTAVSAQIGRLSDLEIDVEDTAEVICLFANGALGSIHLDMVQRPAVRTCRVIGTEGTISWDALEPSVRLFSHATGSWSDLWSGPCDRNEMYVLELRHFLDCVRGKALPVVTGEEGRRVLEIALAVKQSAREQRVINL